MKIYKAKKGSILTDKEAKIYGRCLEKIEKKKGGITSQDVLDEGASVRSPLHSYFVWDNKIAGEKYRLSQAAHLLRSIEIEIKISDKNRRTRAYLNVKISCPDTEKTEGIYVNLKKALTEPEYRKQVLQNAMKEIESWKEKYSLYSELSDIFEAIKKTKKRIK